MAEKKRTLTTKECERVVNLYEKMLDCKNQREGERLANEIDRIIRPASYGSLDAINRSISQRNLPMMMKCVHVLPPPDDKYYSVDTAQIGTYPASNNRMSLSRKKDKEEIHAR